MWCWISQELSNRGVEYCVCPEWLHNVTQAFGCSPGVRARYRLIPYPWCFATSRRFFWRASTGKRVSPLAGPVPENFDFASGQLPDRLIGNRLPIPYIACVQLSWMRFIGLFVRVRQLLFYPLKNCRGDQQVAPTESIWSLRPLLQMSVVRVRQCLPASCG